MHIDLENLSLSVLKTSQALGKLYKSGLDDKYEVDPVVQLVRIYLVQFVLDDASPYSARVREQSLEILREKIEKKEYIQLKDVVKNPLALSTTLSHICNELVTDLKSVEHLINNSNSLDKMEASWKTLLQTETVLGQYQSDLQYGLLQQLGYGIAPEDPAFERFKNSLGSSYNHKLLRIRMGLRAGHDLIQTCEKEEQKFAEEVRDNFMHSMQVAEKRGLVSDEFNRKTLEKVDRFLQETARHTVESIKNVVGGPSKEAFVINKNKM